MQTVRLQTGSQAEAASSLVTEKVRSLPFGELTDAPQCNHRDGANLGYWQQGAVYGRDWN